MLCTRVDAIYKMDWQFIKNEKLIKISHFLRRQQNHHRKMIKTARNELKMQGSIELVILNRSGWLPGFSEHFQGGRNAKACCRQKNFLKPCFYIFFQNIKKKLCTSTNDRASGASSGTHRGLPRTKRSYILLTAVDWSTKNGHWSVQAGNPLSLSSFAAPDSPLGSIFILFRRPPLASRFTKKKRFLARKSHEIGHPVSQKKIFLARNSHQIGTQSPPNLGPGIRQKISPDPIKFGIWFVCNVIINPGFWVPKPFDFSPQIPSPFRPQAHRLLDLWPIAFWVSSPSPFGLRAQRLFHLQPVIFYTKSRGKLTSRPNVVCTAGSHCPDAGDRVRP